MAAKIRQNVGEYVHSYTEQEKVAFVNFVNYTTRGCAQLTEAHYVPIDPHSDQVFYALRDGNVLAHVVAWCAPGAIDFRKLIVAKEGKKLNPFQLTENVKYVLKCMQDAGMVLVNIGPQDIIEGRAHLLFGLLFQLFRRGMDRLMQEELQKSRQQMLDLGIEVDDVQTSADKILVDFFNSGLEKADVDFRVHSAREIGQVNVLAANFVAAYPDKFSQDFL